MEKIKSLADQLREKMAKPVDKTAVENAFNDSGSPPLVKRKISPKTKESDLLTTLLAYDNSENKSMVHVRFTKQTVDLMNKFKMATGVDVTRLVAFAVAHLFENNPELKTTIKQFIQKEL